MHTKRLQTNVLQCYQQNSKHKELQSNREVEQAIGQLDMSGNFLSNLTGKHGHVRAVIGVQRRSKTQENISELEGEWSSG